MPPRIWLYCATQIANVLEGRWASARDERGFETQLADDLDFVVLVTNHDSEAPRLAGDDVTRGVCSALGNAVLREGEGLGVDIEVNSDNIADGIRGAVRCVVG